LGPRAPRQCVHRPAKANSGRSSLSANHVGVLRGFVSGYSTTARQPAPTSRHDTQSADLGCSDRDSRCEPNGYMTPTRRQHACPIESFN
jgi:hypothetical protein